MASFDKKSLLMAARKIAQAQKDNADSTIQASSDLGLALPPEFGTFYDRLRKSVPPADNNANNADADKANKVAKAPANDRVSDLERLTFNTVCDAIGGEVNLSRRKFTDDEIAAVISKLNANQYQYKAEDFQHLLKKARRVRDIYKKQSEAWFRKQSSARHGSLNNFDYDRLKAETEALKQSIAEAERLCPTLYLIVAETEATADSDYPGRHLPFNHISGRSAWRYQCLRIMDEALYTSPSPISDWEMERHILREVDRLNIPIPPRMHDKLQNASRGELVMESSLTHNYVILDEMIAVEQDLGPRRGYELKAFSVCRNGHLYAKVGSGRVTAFKVVFTLDEAFAMQKELELIVREYFGCDGYRFATKFPLLTALRTFDSFGTISVTGATRVNQITNTDLFTINYNSALESVLKRRLEKCINEKTPIALRETDYQDLLLPLKINGHGVLWALTARRVADGTPMSINHKRLVGMVPKPDAAALVTGSQVDDVPVIGTSEIIGQKLWDISLELTDEGFSRSPLTYSILDTFPHTREKVYRNRYDRGEKGDRLHLSLYINEDFFNLLFELDIRGTLISVYPAELMKMYEQHFLRRMGKERVPLAARPVSAKRLRRPDAPTLE